MPNDDSASLRTTQYRDSRNLSARLGLHDRFSVNPLRWHRFVFDHFELPETARVLELGCGMGTLWRENAERIPAGWHIVLADFSPGMLRDARPGLEAVRKFACVAGDAQAVPCADASSDAVVANHMLYHVADIPKAIAEIHRVLKPGGRLYAATNGAGHLSELQGLLAEADIHPDGGEDWTAVIRSFSLENGADLISPHFPEVVLHRYADAMEVTEADPLVAYVASMISVQSSDEDLVRFREIVEARLARGGSIHITKDAGLFIAHKADVGLVSNSASVTQ
jgi:ubiquinone/menaquinone biosynthesis C-methylase UbiE